MLVCVCARVRVVVCLWASVRTGAGALEVRLSIPHLVEERGVKLRLQLLVAVTLDNLCYFLLPPDVRRVVQVTFQTLSSAHVDDRLAHQEPWGREGVKHGSSSGRRGQMVTESWKNCTTDKAWKCIATTFGCSYRNILVVKKITLMFLKSPTA